jgi:hypothetical protein
MPSVVFMYKIGNIPKTYYGKLQTDYISDDHEGLDKVVKYDLLKGLNTYRTNKCMPTLKMKQLKIGILSSADPNNYLDYATKREINCFDFYIWSFNYKTTLYMNGSEIKTL